MKIKVFGIFCLSFLMASALSSCDSEEIIDQQEEVSGNENPTMTVLAEQVAGSDGYDEDGVTALNFPSSQNLHSISSGVRNHKNRVGKCRWLCLGRNCRYPMGRNSGNTCR